MITLNKWVDITTMRYGWKGFVRFDSEMVKDSKHDWKRLTVTVVHNPKTGMYLCDVHAVVWMDDMLTDLHLYEWSYRPEHIVDFIRREFGVEVYLDVATSGTPRMI